MTGFRGGEKVSGLTRTYRHLFILITAESAQAFPWPIVHHHYTFSLKRTGPTGLQAYGKDASWRMISLQPHWLVPTSRLCIYIVLSMYFAVCTLY